MRVSAIVLAITVPILTTSVSAGIVSTYDNLAAFQSDTGSVSISGALPNLGSVGTGAVTVGDVTLDSTSGNLYLGTTGLGGSWSGGWSSLIAGNEIAISGTEDFDITVNHPGGVTAFGFEMHEPTDPKGSTDGCNATCVDSTFELALFAGNVQVDIVTFNVANDQLAFFGLRSDVAFDTVKIVEKLGGIDNEYFGQFYANPRAIPEPASLALLGAGLFGLSLVRRRRGC